MELFTVTEKLKKFFWQVEMFDVWTMGDTAHIDMIFIEYRIDVCRVTCGAHIEHL